MYIKFNLLIHELSEDDPDRRLEFCESFMRHCDDNPNSLNSVVSSDEATLILLKWYRKSTQLSLLGSRTTSLGSNGTHPTEI